jgi:hypothetical protein
MENTIEIWGDNTYGDLPASTEYMCDESDNDCGWVGTLAETHTREVTYYRKAKAQEPACPCCKARGEISRAVPVYDEDRNDCDGTVSDYSERMEERRQMGFSNF